MNKCAAFISILTCIAVIAGCGDDKLNQNDNNATVPEFQLVAPERILAGACAPFRLDAKEPGKEEILFAAEDLSIAMYRDSACRLPIGSVPMETGTDSTGFYVASNHSGPFSLKLNWGPNRPPIRVDGTVLPATSLKLSIEGKSAAIAGECLPVSIRVSDLYGNPANLSKTLTLSNGFFSDAACTATKSIGSLPFDGRSSHDLYVRRTAVGKLPVIARADDVADGVYAPTISAAPLKNVYLTLPRLALNTCGASNVRLGDMFGNEVAATANVQIQVTPAGGAQFFLRDDCSDTPKGGAFNVAIDVGKSRKALYLKGTIAGKPEIRARLYSGTPALIPFAGVFTADIGLNARWLVYTSPTGPISTPRTACTRLTVQLRDSANIPLAALADYSPVLSGSDNKAKFYSDSTCGTPTTKALIVKNSSSAVFYYQDISTTVGDHAADVLASDPNGLYLAAKVRVTSKK